MTLDKALVATLLLILFPACTMMNQSRTDDEAWIQYHQEWRNKRGPASQTSKVDPIELHTFLGKIPVRNFLLNCLNNENLKSCYQSKLSLAFDEAFRNAQKKNPTLSDVAYKMEQKTFFQEVAFEEVFGEVQSFHQMLLSGIDVRAVEHAKELNEECEKNISAEAVVHDFKSFNGGATEVPKGQFACLSEAWGRHADALLDDSLERLGLALATKDTREWIKKYQIYPIFVQETQVHLNQKFEEEKRAWDKKIPSFLPDLEKVETVEKAVKSLSPALRAEFPHLPVEAYLTELYSK